MTLSNELKDFLVRRKEKRGWKNLSNEDCFFAANLILTYLKEFKSIVTLEDFKNETFKLYYYSKSAPDGDVILNDLTSRHGALLNSETGKLYRSDYRSILAGLVSATAILLSDSGEAWQIVAPIFNGKFE